MSEQRRTIVWIAVAVALAVLTFVVVLSRADGQQEQQATRRVTASVEKVVPVSRIKLLESNTVSYAKMYLYEIDGTKYMVAVGYGDGAGTAIVKWEEP
jgi:alanine racemase